MIMAIIQPERRHYESEIAVLQTQFNNLDEKVDEIKNDVIHLEGKIDRYSAETINQLKEFQKENRIQHDIVHDKIHLLEKWRWMLMGAGVLVGSMGYPTIANLLRMFP